MAKLDRSRSFGSVYGSGAGHSFEQDGRLFDHDGNEVGQSRQKSDQKQAKQKVDDDQPAPIDAELSAQLNG